MFATVRSTLHRHAMFSILAGAFVIAGCGRDAQKEYDRAEALMARQQYSSALSAYQSALRTARSKNLDQLSGQIQGKIAEVESKLRDVASDEIRGHLRQAQSQAGSHKWSEVLVSLERARRALDRSPDTQLRQQYDRAMDSQTVKLAQTAQVYARMSREARWSNWQHWLGGNEWFTLGSEVSTSQLGRELERRATSAGDQQVTSGATSVGTAWDKYWLAKVNSRNNQNRARPGADDPAWLHVLSGVVDVAVAGNEIHQGANFDRARQSFETNLDGALNRSTFPTLQLERPAPAPQNAPAATTIARTGGTTGPAAATPSRGGATPGAPGADATINTNDVRNAP